MKKILVGTAVLLAAFVSGTEFVYAQKATEVYIPIGESPGISESSSYIGEITRVDYSAHSLTVRGEADTKVIRVDEQTRYYLDRSGREKNNSIGEMRDCQVGSRIEVSVADNGMASWIKIESD